MSSHQSTFIGAYLVAKNITKPQQYSIKTCSNQECSVRKKETSLNSNFCNDCGAPTESINKTRDVVVSPYTIMEEFGNIDEFFNVGNKCAILLPNRNSKYIIRYDDCDDFIEKELMNKQDALTDFTKKHKPFMDFLTSKGIEHQIKFGVVGYYY